MPFDYEPTVRVGLASGSGFGITLHGDYDISPSEDSIIYSPISPDAHAEIKGIAIGKGFHWQRNENELFHGRLQLLRHNDTTYLINILPVEQYLMSVISSEMNAEAPLEFLKAHAIISRSWLMRILTRQQGFRALSLQQTESKPETKSKFITWTDNEAHTLFDVCADDHCQRYHGIGRQNDKAVEAVNMTRGVVLVDMDGEIADARFSKCCGGKSEIFSTCWADHDPHYLQSVDDPYCHPAFMQSAGLDHKTLSTLLNDFDIETQDFYIWQETVNKNIIRANLKQLFNIDIGNIVAIEPIYRGKSGRIHLLKVIGKVGNVEIGKELSIRKLLSESCLKSSAFDIISTDSESITLNGKGWGHGVGLCQIGAAVMGAIGKSHADILAHYYPGTEIKSYY